MAQEDVKIDPKEAEKTATRLAALESPTDTKKEDSPKVEVTETAEKPDKTPEQPKTEAKAEEVPDDPKEAGKAFAEMRNRIKDLEKDKVEQEAAKEAEIQAPVSPDFENPYQLQNPVQQNTSQFFDSQTGEFDLNKYDQSKTKEVRSEVKQGIDDYRQEQEAYSDYPELDPKHKEHNKEFFEAVRGRLTDSMLHPGRGGKVLSMKEAADAVLNLSQTARSKVEAEGAKKAMEEVAVKESASLEAGGSSNRAASSDAAADLEELSEQSRKGGREGSEAIADRIKRLGM